MIPTNLLHSHIVFCGNLQLIVRWWFRVTLRLWGSCTLGVQISIRVWREVFPLLTSWIAHEILVSALSSVGMMCLALLYMPWSSCQLPQSIRHGDQYGLDVMYQCCCHDHHLGLIEMLHKGSSHSTGSSFAPPPVGNDGDITPVLVIFLCLSIFECSCFHYCVYF